METNAVDVILKHKRTYSKSESLLCWALVNGLAAFALFYDLGLNESHASKLLPYELARSVIRCVELASVILFSWNTVFNLGMYLWPNISMQYIALKPTQKQLLGIKDSDAGFKMSTPKKATGSVNSGTPDLLSSYVQPIYQMTPPAYSPYGYGNCTPMDYSAASWASSLSPNGSMSASWSYYQDYPNNSFEGSFQETTASEAKRNSFTAQCKITNEKTLEQFLNDYKTFEQKSAIKENQSFMQTAANQSMWKFQYQPACRSPQSSLTMTDSEQTSFSGDMIFGRLKVSEEVLSAATENLRKWLSQTVLGPIVSEIKSINETLKRLGSSDLQIGSVSLTTLRQIMTTKAQILTTLPSLIPYLDVTVNQEYLIQRLEELSKGGCMSDFNWNGGGKVNGKTWSDELPTDCMIAMHVLCSYLDARLPPNPNYPDGKTFSSKYFKKSPSKPVLLNDSLYIFQSKLNPPHYKLAIGEELLDVPRGRNNMFFTILLFLHYIKENQCGMLGRINLGSSGVNILWVVDDLKE